MVDDVDEGLFSQAPLADGFMAVLEGGERRHAVVQVDGVQAFQAQHGVELFQHGVQAVDDVVPGGINVAGVQADAQLFFQVHALNDGGQFFKGLAELASLAGHGFQQNGGFLVRSKHAVQLVRHQFNAFFHSLSHVAAGMEVVKVARQMLHELQVFPQHLGRKAGDFGVSGAGVQRIRGVRQQRAEVVVFRQLQKTGNVRFVNGLGLASARVAGKELESVGADGKGNPAHGFVTFCGGEVASDVQHGDKGM